MEIRRNRPQLIWSSFLTNLFFILVSAGILIPFFLVLSISITEEKSLLMHGYLWIPKSIDFTAYLVLFKTPLPLIRAYGITIAVTLLGTFAGLLLTTMTAYVLSRREFRYGRILSFYVFFTMLFSGGLVPFYMLMTQVLHLRDTIWALILPMLLSPFFVMIMKGFLAKIPGEIIESVKMDGAGEWLIFFRIIVPLSTPALVTIGLMISFGYWNDWWNGLLFIDNPNLVPLQLLLYRNMNTIEFLRSAASMHNLQTDISQFPKLSARMAMVVISAGPMMIVFPFFQRYFVQGLTIGAIKG